MNNQEIAQVFESIAGLLELKGEQVFTIRAYQRAARTIDHLPMELERMVREEQDLKQLPGIGKAIDEKIRELITTDRLEFYEELKAEFPDGLLRLMEVPGIGPKTAMRICQELGISTVEALEQAIEVGALAKVPRLGEKSAQNILRHIRSLRSKDRRVPIGKALPVAEEIIAALRQVYPGLGEVNVAGSLRRFRETVGDIDVMGTAEDPAAAIDAFVELPMVVEVLGHGPKKASVYVEAGLQVDFRIVPAEQYGSLLQYFTGSQQHNILLREYANRRGLSLNEYGITVERTGELETFADEESFYARLGLQYIPPELREGMWEIERAERHALPRLVEEGDIRGDLHLHTNESDGRNTLEEMVEAARRRGYEYIAITDHSQGRGIANGLSLERLRAHIAAIRALDLRTPDIKLLTGSEVDIRADGSLDYQDEVLRDLDVVVASVHSAMGQDEETMTQRIIRAMRNPYVTAIGHLTTRLLGQREPIAVDLEAVLQAAAETGTALEINASPERLDLKDLHVLRARELGVSLCINTDAHTTDGYAAMRFGVAVARRGWCEPHHIVNTRPCSDFLEFLQSKRSHLVA